MPFVERDGIRVGYEVEGNGPPLVLLPGAGCDGSFWRRTGYVAELAGAYRCIAVDPRGFGRSSRPADAEALGMDEQAHDILAIVEALELERFALWGQSAGAFVAFIVAAAAGSRVSAIVASGGAPPLDESEWREWCDLQRAFAASARATAGWKGLIEGVAAQEGLALPAWVGEIDADLELTSRLLERLPGERFRPEWLQLEPPCLLVLGELEEDPGWIERARTALPQVRIVVLPGLGHVGGILAREQTLSHVLPFLARVPAPA